MATIVSHRSNDRREISLAMSPPVAVVAVDNDTSPHLSTLQSANEKAKKSELNADPAMDVNLNVHVDVGLGDNTIIPDPQAVDEDEPGQEPMSGVDDAAQSGEMRRENSGTSSSRDGDPPCYLPSHLCESNDNEAGAHQNQAGDDKEESKDPPPPSQLDSEDKEEQTSESAPSYAPAKDGTDGTTAPTGLYMHQRIPSSSIPHLMSSSASISADPQQLLHQLSFVGIDGALSPALLSREESFAFPVDGDDSVFKKGASSPQVIPTPPQAHLGMNLAQGISPLQGGLVSNLSSSVSLASYHSASYNSATQNFLSSYTPPNALNFTSPPQKVLVSENINMQGLQPGLDMPVLNQAAAAAISPDEQADIAQAGQMQSMLPTGACLPLPTQPLALPYQTNQYPKQSMVQPVLYSAINSLERYNAGSFDNKVMLAKARGTYGKQKAFPGVPKKKEDRSDGLGSTVDSGLESKGSSAVGRKSSVGSSMDDLVRKHEAGNIQSSTITAQPGVEQTVPLANKTARIYKSKSSGTLGGSRADSVEDIDGNCKNLKSDRSVTIRDDRKPPSRKGSRRREKKVGVFRPSSDAYTPRMGNRNIKYKPAQERASVEKISSTMGTIQRPNFRDALRRVAIILHQHIVKIERRFSTGVRGLDDTGLFKASMKEEFNEDNFATPRYKCSMVRVPMARPGVVYSMRKIRVVHTTPTTDEIYDFAHQLFKKVQLSSECSIVCLIYVEKLMEVAKVPLVAETWRPIFMCGLLLASKVWQDLSSWNIEFASVYPQFSLDAINRLELSFLKFIKWDLYISSSLYAKYYFALRSLLEKSGFRDRYNQMVGGIGGIAASEAIKVSKRSEAVKEEALLQLSRSM